MIYILGLLSGIALTIAALIGGIYAEMVYRPLRMIEGEIKKRTSEKATVIPFYSKEDEEEEIRRNKEKEDEIWNI